MVWKKSPLSWKEQGMSRSARAAASAGISTSSLCLGRNASPKESRSLA